MQLQNLYLDQLSISPLNMRHGKTPPDVSDMLASVRARGVRVPLLVRPEGGPLHFGVVAGRRRFFAAKAVQKEAGTAIQVPCGILEEGDDAAAIEDSMIENMYRDDPDEMTQYETFTKLIKAGRGVADIAAHFGLRERVVEQRLAIGNLLPRIREAFRHGQIDPDTLRHLTAATKRQQGTWLKMFEAEDENTPTGADVKHWLCGGQAVSTTVALFPLTDYTGQVIADLFGENGSFADPAAFWELQNKAIAARRDAYLAAGWEDVVILETGDVFQSWQHEKAAKRKGGKVFVSVSQRGEVTFFEGYVTRKEARRKDSKTPEGEADVPKGAAPEVTSALQAYIDLHRHAGVRAKLLDNAGAALRLMVAHAIGGSRLWNVKPEPQRSGREATDASVKASPAQAAFDQRRAEALDLLGLPKGAALVAGHDTETPAIFARLLGLGDKEVRRILAVVMADTLESGSALVEGVGVHLGVDLQGVWTADDSFFDLLRDKTTIAAMVKETAGKAVADANLAATGKVQKQIIRDCLAGSNGRAKVKDWLPGWFAFPVRSYRKDGGLATLARWKSVKRLFGG